MTSLTVIKLCFVALAVVMLYVAVLGGRITRDFYRHGDREAPLVGAVSVLVFILSIVMLAMVRWEFP